MEGTMHLPDVAVKLFEFVKKSKVIIVTWDPKNFDSTTLAKLQIKIKFQNLKEEFVSFSVNSSNSLLLTNILQKVNQAHKTIFIGHDFKKLFSFFKRVSKKPLELTNVFDLSWYESYYSLPSSENDFKTMISRLKEWIANQQANQLYKLIYGPLITSVLPSIESVGLINQDTGLLVFPNFVVEGQNNGRLSCICEYKRCYNPHSLSDKDKEFLSLPASEEIFIWYDYNNMEVAVLAELAHDDNLRAIINEQPNKVYERIFEIITGTTNENSRKLAKLMFLPAIYGQGVNGMAKTLDVSQEQAAIYLHNMTDKFKKSFAYVEKFQKQAAETGVAIDHFGRIRLFSQENSFKARNFAVQSPSALLCLESLVNLQNTADNYKVVFTVHDGYCIAGPKYGLEEAYKKAKNILQKKSEFIPISLNVSVKLGKNLAKMTTLGKR
jgi:DNA polymerase I-like protein with 3'-5' exonuclease and polymerase domains